MISVGLLNYQVYRQYRSVTDHTDKNENAYQIIKDDREQEECAEEC